MKRRAFLALGGPAIAAGLMPGRALALDATTRAGFDELDAALARFRALPGETSYRIDIGSPVPSWRAEHRSTVPMFVGSAVKTFILTQYLKDVETGRLSESQQLPINDSVRSLSSPVFEKLTGTTAARSVLEAMIAHSDNTATDAALLRTRSSRVRDFIAAAGLTSVRIPGSTRILFSYLAGARSGVDLGWAGMQAIERGQLFGNPRSPINDKQTMMASARDMVAFYRRALLGEFFAKPETLTEFKRISAMADAVFLSVPPDTIAYGKGGSINWQDFNAFALPGQMILATGPVTFGFTINWTGPEGEVPVVFAQFAGSVQEILKQVKVVFG